MFNDLNDEGLIEAYERVIILDDIYKSNVVSFWNENFIEIVVDLGLFKNIRSVREFTQKEDDFILKMGIETITIEKGTIMVPKDILFLLITKKFKFLTKRNFNLALTRLKAVRCEKSSTIHHFIYEIGENDVILSDDLYYILEQYGNIYQAIKMEITIEGFYKRFDEISNKIDKYIDIFDPTLSSKKHIRKINQSIEENKDLIAFLKEENIKIPEKLNPEKIDVSDPIYLDWHKKLLRLLKLRFSIKKIEKKLLEIKKYYSGKNKKYSYLEFIEKVSFNEDDIVNQIQESLITLRETLIEINKEISELRMKDLKLLNLDYERLIISSSEN
jgi:hypothetical protein